MNISCAIRISKSVMRMVLNLLGVWVGYLLRKWCFNCLVEILRIKSGAMNHFQNVCDKIYAVGGAKTWGRPLCFHTFKRVCQSKTFILYETITKTYFSSFSLYFKYIGTYMNLASCTEPNNKLLLYPTKKKTKRINENLVYSAYDM